MIPNGTLFFFVVIFGFLACNNDKNKSNNYQAEANPKILENITQDSDTTSLMGTVDSDTIVQQDTKLDSIDLKLLTKEPKIISAKAGNKTPKKKKSKLQPVVTFKELVYDFGTINEGDIIEHKFVFKNTGKAPLEIKSVNVSCGCTYPSYPFLDIEPGDTGHIGVTYKSAGKSGFQNPKLTVKTNITNQEFYLHLKGNVIKKEAESLNKENGDTDLDTLMKR